MADVELAPDKRWADVVDEIAVGVPLLDHARLYQRRVDTSRAFLLIAIAEALTQDDAMSFGARLTAAWKSAGYKTERQAALACELSPQRFNNYIKGRIPDKLTLQRIAEKFNTTPGALLNEGADEALKDILLRLFELEGIPADRADTLASAAIEAKRLLEALPDEGPVQVRAQLAAHAAWSSQPLLLIDR
jgi:transcriptional regulator with XRE-family HTH domain